MCTSMAYVYGEYKSCVELAKIFGADGERRTANAADRDPSLAAATAISRTGEGPSAPSLIGNPPANHAAPHQRREPFAITRLT